MKRKTIDGNIYYTLDMSQYKPVKHTLLGSLSYLYSKPTKDMTERELDMWHEILESNKD